MKWNIIFFTNFHLLLGSRLRPMLKKNVVPSLKLSSSSGPPQKLIATVRSKRATKRQIRKKLAEDTVMGSLRTGNSESDQEDSQLSADTDVM
jgi:hypothetical protein